MQIPNKDITVITKTRKFSDEVVHFPNFGNGSECFGFEPGSVDKDHYFEIIIQANAKEKEDFGRVHVLIREYHLDIFSSFEGTVFISVRDASGIQRFPQSFTIINEPRLSSTAFEEYGYLDPSDYTDTWRTINYIKRETLLDDPEELLPNDTLTLEIEINANGISRNHIYDSSYLKNSTTVINSSLRKEKVTENEIECYLLLDSPLADILSKESIFFQRLLNTSMLEGRTRRLNISSFEYYTLIKIAELLLCDTYFIISSVTDIFQMYFVADKYDILLVIETCVTFLKLYHSHHSSEDLWRLTLSTDVSRMVSYENLVSKLFSEEMEDSTQNFALDQKVASSGWIYKNEKFHYEYGTSGMLFENPYKSDMHFYK